MATKEDKAQFDIFLATWEVERRDNKAKAKEDLYLLLDQYPNITAIEVIFDGCGDSGQVEDIEYSGESADDAIPRKQELDDAVEEYVYSILPGGWEINDGSFGTIHINVKARTAVCNFSWRTSEDASFMEE
jgi:hypothetical protein